MRILFLLLLLPFIGFSQYGIQSPVKAFPNAYGGGAEATGGRGKRLYIVTTLDRTVAGTFNAASGGDDAYYTGGFEDALRSDDVGYIVFNVSGEIDLGSGGTVNWSGCSGQGCPDIVGKTIFGQSAPRGGITLTGGTFRIGGYELDADLGNLVFRYMRSRPLLDSAGNYAPGTDDSYTWGWMFAGGDDIVVDHCSSSFAYDKAIGLGIREQHVTNTNCPCTAYRYTFSHNLVGDSHTGMYASINGGRPNDPEEYVDEISFFNNVLVSVNRTPNIAFDGFGEVVNNVVHDSPNKGTRTYHDINLNVLNNHYGTKHAYNWVDTDSEPIKLPSIYAKGAIFSGTVNGVTSNFDGTLLQDNRQMWTDASRSTYPGDGYFTDTKHTWPGPYPYVETSASQAFTNLVTNGDVGAYKYLDDSGNVQTYRDSYDAGLLTVVANNQDYANNQVANWVMPNLPNNTRPAGYDSDNDGMADDWELEQFGDLDESYRGDFDGDGYENIEEYMNQVDGLPDGIPPPAVQFRARNAKKNVPGAIIISH